MPGQLHDPLRFDMLFMFGLSAAIYFNRARARLGDFLELSSRLIITFFDSAVYVVQNGAGFGQSSKP